MHGLFSFLVRSRLISFHFQKSIVFTITKKKNGLFFSEDRDLLAYEIHSYMSTTSNRTDEGKYQCTICGLKCRDLYNQREHVLTHMMTDPKFNARFLRFVSCNTVKDLNNVRTCRICQTKLANHVRKHFVNKHLRVSARDAI